MRNVVQDFAPLLCIPVLAVELLAARPTGLRETLLSRWRIRLILRPWMYISSLRTMQYFPACQASTRKWGLQSARQVDSRCSQRLQLIHDPRAHLHQPMPVPHQLSQISVLRARYPNLRKIIFPHQPEQELGILAVGLLLLHSSGFDFCGIADPQLET